MACADGSLRKLLPNIIKCNWHTKLSLLSYITLGLNNLHNLNLVHRDLHDGNILTLYDHISAAISDLGLCKPVNH